MARDWNKVLRPRNWDTVIGQAHLADTFQKMIMEDSFPAFSIFSGPTGIGKSCVAELVAKSLKCTGEVVPCNECANCLAANKQQSVDIIKCDMPNKSDADVSDLIQSIFHMEGSGIRIYIIEEAHTMHKQTTQPRWLEPLTHIPENVYIIFCTTQIYSLISELRGRASCYSFEVPSDSECLKLIERLSRQFKFSLPDMDILLYFIHNNRNSPRGIISTLETFVTSDTLNAEQIRNFAHLPEPELYANVLSALTDKSTSIYDFIRLLHSDENINCCSILRGMQQFVLSVLLEISLNIPQGFTPETTKKVQEVLSQDGETALLKITTHLGTVTESQLNDKNDALMCLVTLKLKLAGQSTKQLIANNLAQASEATVTSLSKSTAAIQRSGSAPTSEFITSSEEIQALMNGE